MPDETQIRPRGRESADTVRLWAREVNHEGEILIFVFNDGTAPSATLHSPSEEHKWGGGGPTFLVGEAVKTSSGRATVCCWKEKGASFCKRPIAKRNMRPGKGHRLVGSRYSRQGRVPAGIGWKRLTWMGATEITSVWCFFFAVLPYDYVSFWRHPSNWL